MKRNLFRAYVAFRMFCKCGIGLRWTPATAWSVAGTVLEFRDFRREHGIYRDGPWLVGRISDDEPGVGENRTQ